MTRKKLIVNSKLMHMFNKINRELYVLINVKKIF
jgi:hypothetical protein